MIVKPDERFGDETRAILAVWGKGVPVADGVRDVGRAVEAWEAGLEGDWAWDEEGGVCLRSRAEAEGGEIDAEGVVDWLKEVARKELSGGLFLRWLDELQMLRRQSGFEAAKR